MGLYSEVIFSVKLRDGSDVTYKNCLYISWMKAGLKS